MHSTPPPEIVIVDATPPPMAPNQIAEAVKEEFLAPKPLGTGRKLNNFNRKQGSIREMIAMAPSPAILASIIEAALRIDGKGEVSEKTRTRWMKAAVERAKWLAAHPPQWEKVSPLEAFGETDVRPAATTEDIVTSVNFSRYIFCRENGVIFEGGNGEPLAAIDYFQPGK